jgi:hypothetical protein
MKDKVDPSYMQDINIEIKNLSCDMEPDAEEMIRSQEFKVGEPVWFEWENIHGWGLVKSVSKAFPYLALVSTLDRTFQVSPMKMWHEKQAEPMREVKHSLVTDDDGEEIQVSFGEYKTEDGNQFIFSIDTPFETVSFSMKDTSKLIEAIKEVTK